MVVRPASKASRSSNTAGYRTVGKQSEVDESLFGNNKPGGKPGASSQVETLHTSPSRAPAQAAPETVTLTRGELHRMMGASPIVTLPQAAALKKAAQAKLDEERRVSNARKTRMLALEEERKKIQPATESEMLKQAADAKTLTHAEKLLREQQDEAKAMNQMMLYSKCVTIRDAQLQEKKHMMLEEEEEQRRLDLMMEIERIKALENFEERERQRKVERMKGAKVLQEQLEERRRDRIQQEELRERERIVMLKEMERLREEELRAQVEKQMKAKDLVAQVMTANEEQVERKKEMQQLELDEEARIADYIRVRDLREQAVADEKEAIAREKEAETQRLRAAQEKAADKQSEMDELRARRHAAAAERERRGREASKAARNKAILVDLHTSREAQKAAKITQQAEMAVLETKEFQRILRSNKEKEHQEMKLTVQEDTLRKQYQSELLAQIAAAEEQRKSDRQNYLEEGRKVRQSAEDYLKKVQAIKAAKLAELRAQGVPDKYCAELARYKVH